MGKSTISMAISKYPCNMSPKTPKGFIIPGLVVALEPRCVPLYLADGSLHREILGDFTKQTVDLGDIEWRKPTRTRGFNHPKIGKPSKG
jgi:hypothetical protein